VSCANGWVVNERNSCLSKGWIPAKPALRAFCESRRPVFAEKLKHRATRNRASKDPDKTRRQPSSYSFADLAVRRASEIQVLWPGSPSVWIRGTDALESQGCGTRPTLSEGHSPLSPQNCFPFSRPLTIDWSYMWPRHSRQHGTFRLHLPAGSFSWTDF
jgi:hypothetical protein